MKLKFNFSNKILLFVAGAIIGAISLCYVFTLYFGWEEGSLSNPYGVLLFGEGNFIWLVGPLLTIIATIAMIRLKKRWMYPISGFGIGWYVSLAIAFFILAMSFSGS